MKRLEPDLEKLQAYTKEDWNRIADDFSDILHGLASAFVAAMAHQGLEDPRKHSQALAETLQHFQESREIGIPSMVPLLMYMTSYLYREMEIMVDANKILDGRNN